MLNQNPMKMESSRLLSFLEREVLAKLHRLIYGRDDAFYGEQMHAKDAALGVMTSGGTIANVTALWLARNRACGDNLFALYEQGYRGAVILGSRLMHYSFDKGMDLLGLGARSVWRLETDEQNRLSLAALEQALIQCKEQKLKVLALVGVAGSTDFGSIDPLPELADHRRARADPLPRGCRLGWPDPLLPPLSRSAGRNRAGRYRHSGWPQTAAGATRYRHATLPPADLMMAVKREAPYAIRATSFDQGRFTLEGTRPANALYLDAAFQLFGQQGYAELIEANYDRARLMAELITSIRPSS